MKALTTLTQQNLNAKLKLNKELVKESYTSLGKIRNMALTINGLDTDIVGYLKGTKVKNEFGKLTYNALAQTMYFDLNGNSNITEMLTTLTKIYISVQQYQANLITIDGLKLNLNEYYTKKVTSKVTAQKKNIAKIETTILNLKESYKKSSFPLVKELLTQTEDKLKKANVKLELLENQLNSFDSVILS